MKQLLFFLMIFSISSNSFSQTDIIKKVSVNGYKYQQNQKLLTIHDLNEVLKSNEDAYRLLYDARQYRGMSQVMGSVGSFIVGFQLGKTISGGEFRNVPAFIGAGLIAIAIPIHYSQNKKIARAVDVYNDNLSNTTDIQVKISLVSNLNGVGLCFNF